MTIAPILPCPASFPQAAAQCRKLRARQYFRCTRPCRETTQSRRLFRRHRIRLPRKSENYFGTVPRSQNTLIYPPVTAMQASSLCRNIRRSGASLNRSQPLLPLERLQRHLVFEQRHKSTAFDRHNIIPQTGARTTLAACPGFGGVLHGPEQLRAISASES